MALTQVPGSCNGRNVSPALAWSGEPASTQNFALTMVDTDARNGRGPVAFERVQYSGLGHGLAAGAGSAGSKDFPAALSYRKYGIRNLRLRPIPRRGADYLDVLLEDSPFDIEN